MCWWSFYCDHLFQILSFDKCSVIILTCGSFTFPLPIHTVCFLPSSCPSKKLFPGSFPTETLCVFLFSTIPTTCPAYLNLLDSSFVQYEMTCMSYRCPFFISHISPLLQNSRQYESKINLLLFILFSQVFSFPVHFFSWITGKPHHSGFKFQVVAMFLVWPFCIEDLLSAFLILFLDIFF